MWDHFVAPQVEVILTQHSRFLHGSNKHHINNFSIKASNYSLNQKNTRNKNWDKSIESAKELIRQLSEDYASEVYAEKYVSKFMKMRTLHSAEADVYLDEIYTPLTLTVQSNDDQVVIEG